MNNNIYTTGLIDQDCSVTATFAPIGSTCHRYNVNIGPGVSYVDQQSVSVRTEATISTTGSITLNPGSTVNYTSGVQISLGNGFQVLEGSQFRANIDLLGCTGI